MFQKKKPKRPCYYCGEESQLVRHLKRKHKMEDAVVAALKLSKMEQHRAFEKNQKRWNFENERKCHGKGSQFDQRKKTRKLQQC